MVNTIKPFSFTKNYLSILFSKIYHQFYLLKRSLNLNLDALSQPFFQYSCILKLSKLCDRIWIKRAGLHSACFETKCTRILFVQYIINTLQSRADVYVRISTRRSIYYRKYVLQIMQPSQYRYTQLQYGFAVLS